MKKQNKIIMIAILMVVGLMAVGYANVGTIGLNITGSASASATQDNFKVYYTGENTVKLPNTDAVTVDVAANSDTADVVITGLSKKGDTAYAILEIINDSNDVDASAIEVTTPATDTAIFDIEVVMCDSTGAKISDYAVASGDVTYVKVSATLLQTPTSDVTTTISAKITATPKAVQ